jgi:competence protein ComEA
MRFIFLFLISLCFAYASVALNSANVKELTSLKGIGAKKAQEIISYRKAHGCFSSIEELAKVKGIGVKTLEKNKDSLILGECKK